MKKLEKMYEGNIQKNYLFFAVPLILSAVLSQSYNLINSMMIGKFLGSDAFAATAVTAQLLELINSIFFGYLTGIGIYVSVLYGKNEFEKMYGVIKNTFIVSSVFAITVSVLCNIFCSKIFEALNVGEDVYRNAELYFRTYCVGYVFFQFNWGFTYISNGMGLTKMPLCASVVVGILNVTLNYIFLSVLGKGIFFSALSTVIATSCATIFYFIVHIRIMRSLGLRLRKVTANKAEMKNSFLYGFPTMVQQMVMYSCTAFVSPLTNTCSTAAISGYSIADKARALATAVYQNSSKANTTFVAQALGAGKIDKIKQGIKIGVIQGLIFFAIAIGLFSIFAKEFTGFFLDSVKDKESFIVSINIIRFLLPLLIFNVFNNFFHGIFRAVGSGKILLTSTIIYTVSFVIYAYILFYILPYDARIYSVHLALGIAYATELIYAGYIYYTGKWKSPRYIELEKSYL